MFFPSKYLRDTYILRGILYFLSSFSRDTFIREGMFISKFRVATKRTGKVADIC